MQTSMVEEQEPLGIDLDPMFEAFQKKPETFFKEVLGIDYMPEYQKQAIRDVVEFERVCIAACHDLGKTFLVARLVIWYLICFPYSKVITTAPTYNQVKNILWAEIRSACSRAHKPLGGVLNLTDWHLVDTGDWFAIGFTPRNELSTDQGQGTQSSFQGFHAPHIMVVFDEATGVPYNIWTMAEGLLTSQNVRFVAIGNPTSRISEFFQCFRSRAWHKIYLSCFDSPNLIANGITDLDKLKKEIEKVRALTDNKAQERLQSYKAPVPYLLTLKWVVASILKWGIDHPLTVSKVLGKFPEAGDNTLVPLGFLEEAQLRAIFPETHDRRILGVDVARFGTDSTVITSMHGKKQTARKELFKNDAIQVTGEVIASARDLAPIDVIVVDETGVGGGVVDLLKDAVRNGDLPKRCEIRGVQFGAACENEEDKEKYSNMKARIFGLLRDDIKSDDGISIINDSIYLDELPTILFTYNKKGQLVIESKDEYKKRTGRKSPDNSDSLALANFGRYDEMNIGNFTKSTIDKIKPLAGGLRTGKNW